MCLQHWKQPDSSYVHKSLICRIQLVFPIWSSSIQIRMDARLDHWCLYLVTSLLLLLPTSDTRGVRLIPSRSYKYYLILDLNPMKLVNESDLVRWKCFTQWSTVLGDDVSKVSSKTELRMILFISFSKQGLCTECGTTLFILDNKIVFVYLTCVTYSFVCKWWWNSK